MESLTIYQKPTCTTCRQVAAILKDEKIPHELVNYYVEPLSESKIKDLLKKMGMPAQELLRKKEAVYKELGLDKKDVPESELIRLMAKHPDLIQRPIVERGKKAILARPSERLREILK